MNFGRLASLCPTRLPPRGCRRLDRHLRIRPVAREREAGMVPTCREEPTVSRARSGKPSALMHASVLRILVNLGPLSLGQRDAGDGFARGPG